VTPGAPGWSSPIKRFSLRGYALLSDACVSSLGMDRAGLRVHSERYEDIGEITGVVIDLQEAWHATAPVRLADPDADILLSADVAAPVASVWDAQTDAAEQLRWRVGVTRVEPRLGAKTHCVHGNTTITQEIVDWRPQRYYSYAERNPIGQCLWTIELEPLAQGGTRIVWRVALAGGRVQRVLYAVVGGRVRRLLKANIDALAAFVEDPSH
jgi:uncharacterized protein YndB with AHSA1/START domain